MSDRIHPHVGCARCDFGVLQRAIDDAVEQPTLLAEIDRALRTLMELRVNLDRLEPYRESARIAEADADGLAGCLADAEHTNIAWHLKRHDEARAKRLKR